MARRSAAASPTSTLPPIILDAGGDEAPDSRWLSDTLVSAGRAVAPGGVRRTRRLLLLGLIGAALLVLWLRTLAGLPYVEATFRVQPGGTVVLLASGEPALRGLAGRQLRALVDADGRELGLSHAFETRSQRWVVDDADRRGHLAWRDGLAQAMGQPRIGLRFDDGRLVQLAPRERGLPGLGALCWLFCGLALVLYVAAAVVLLGRVSTVSMLYAVLAAAQAFNLLLVGADALPGLGAAPEIARHDMAWRLLADAVAGAALVHVVALYPTRLTAWPWVAAATWTLSLGTAVTVLAVPLAGQWWWAQGLMVVQGLAAIAVLRSSARRTRNPLAALLTRLVMAGTGTLVLLSLAIALASHAGLPEHGVAAYGSMIWQVFFASLLMLSPFLSRSRQVVREFATLAGISTVCASLDLLFIAVLGFTPLVALGTALALSLLLYVGVRQWLLAQLAGSGGLTAERMFENLYRAARALEQSPEQAGEQLGTLLREVFDPLELTRSARLTSRIRVATDGSTLVVPVPQLVGGGNPGGTVVLRFAHRGRHLFTREDVRLTERIVEQLRRAVAYDRAVEHGRSEERTRIAQDLHDDIGARLLTLMYKAPNAEIEEYIRHTLQDLKTLTRGLAASSHRLTHAAAEWKADLSQRLDAAGCDLHWSFSTDQELTLSVVQWSGLTRVLRELANNIIAHAQASQVEVTLQVERGRLQLVVSDDGIGRAPQTWSHGLGLGGVRKRVKLLGGEVLWREREGHGIRCEVRAPLASEKPAS